MALLFGMNVNLIDTEITILTDTDKPIIIFMSWPVTDKSKIVKFDNVLSK